MIIIVGGRLYRALVFLLIFLLILPLLHYYARQAARQTVIYRLEGGETVTVSAVTDNPAGAVRGMGRFMMSLHDFYQNGL